MEQGNSGQGRGNFSLNTSRPSRRARKSRLVVPANGRFPATSLDLSMARPGQLLSLGARGRVTVVCPKPKSSELQCQTGCRLSHLTAEMTGFEGSCRSRLAHATDCCTFKPASRRLFTRNSISLGRVICDCSLTKARGRPRRLLTLCASVVLTIVKLSVPAAGRPCGAAELPSSDFDALRRRHL
jgi:hypothetical protein